MRLISNLVSEIICFMRVHLIAIGGSAMHNMALSLHHKGYDVTASDDEIFEPSKSRLKKHGLLPKRDGWFTDRITKDIDAVILGMHAKEDNPELIKAQKMEEAISIKKSKIEKIDFSQNRS